jgi:hypothetical protein
MPVKLGGGGGGGLGGTFTEVIITSQTYTVPYTARMTIWAIGGGGGGQATITSGGLRTTPGGAAGGLACSELPVTAGDQYVLTIGAAGAGGNRSGQYVNTTGGGTGGTTTVTGPGIASNAVLTATGGASGNTTTGGVGTNGNLKNTTGGAAGIWAGGYAPNGGNWAMGGGAVGLGADGSVGNTPPRYVYISYSNMGSDTCGGGAGTGNYANIQTAGINAGGMGGFQRLGDIYCDGFGGERSLHTTDNSYSLAGTGGGGAGCPSHIMSGYGKAATHGGMFGGGGGAVWGTNLTTNGGNGGMGGGGGAAISGNSGQYRATGGYGGSGGVIIYMRPA